MIKFLTTYDELIELHKVLEAFYEKMPYKKKTLDASVWANKWMPLIESKAGTVIAAIEGEKMIGGIGLLTYPAFEDDVLNTQEAFWYVDEKYRGSGVKLYKAAEEYAKKVGSKRFTMIFLETSMPEKVEIFYKKMGFNKAETTYIKEL